MSVDKQEHVTVTHGGAGYFAAHIVWVDGMGWDVQDTGDVRSRDMKPAIEEAREWALDLGIPLRLPDIDAPMPRDKPLDGPAFQAWRIDNKLSRKQVAEDILEGDEGSLRYFESGMLQKDLPWCGYAVEHRVNLYIYRRSKLPKPFDRLKKSIAGPPRPKNPKTR